MVRVEGMGRRKGKEQGTVLWQVRGGGAKGGDKAWQSNGQWGKVRQQGDGEEQNCGAEHRDEASSEVVTKPGSGMEPGVTCQSGVRSALVGVGLGVLVGAGLDWAWCSNWRRAGGWRGWLAYS